MTAARSPRPPRASRGPAVRRGRPPQVSTEALLEAARQVFLERGIRATTLEVAERAGVSEGTLFHRFKSKDALFRAAMRVDPEATPPFVERLAEAAGRGEVRENLVTFAHELIEIARVALPIMMMSWSNPVGEYGFESIGQWRPSAYAKAIAVVREYLAEETRLGRLAAKDAPLVARMLIGSVHHYCMSELFLVEESPRRPAPRAFAESLVDALLRLVAPASKKRSSPERHRTSRRV